MIGIGLRLAQSMCYVNHNDLHLVLNELKDFSGVFNLLGKFLIFIN